MLVDDPPVETVLLFENIFFDVESCQIFSPCGVLPTILLEVNAFPHELLLISIECELEFTMVKCF